MKRQVWLTWFLILCFISVNFPLHSSIAATTSQEIRIPEQFGTRLHQSEGNKGPFVVLIQDIHAQYEAQIQIKNILNYLIQKYGVKLVGLEGGSGQLHPEYFDFYKDKSINLKIADRLVQEGELSGAELSAIENPSTHWVGVENIELYRDNLLQFQSVYKNLENQRQKLRAEKNRLAKLKTENFSKELLKFDALRTRYHDNRDGLLGYVKYLEKKAHQKIDIKNLNAEEFFGEIQRLENKIYSKLTRKPIEQQILEKARNIELREKLSRLEVSRSEYSSLKPNSLLPVAEKFYKQTLERDKALIINLLKAVKENKQDIAVLVSGGFHTPGIEQFLSEKNISYITVIPKFNALTQKSNYLNVILNQSTWLENKSGFFNKIAPSLLINEDRTYPRLNAEDPSRQRKIIAGSFLRALSNYGNSERSKNSFLTVIEKDREVIISPKTHLSSSDFFAAQQFLGSNHTPEGRPVFVSTGASLGTDSPIVRKILDERTADGIAALIVGAFHQYADQYKRITGNAQNLFETRNWKQVLSEAHTRINMYRLSLDVIEAEVKGRLKERVTDTELWATAKKSFLEIVKDEYDSDLALTYFYSVMRRMYLNNGTSIEYTDDGIKEDHEQVWKRRINKPYKEYSKWDLHPHEMIKRILLDREFKAGFEDINSDSELIFERIQEKLIKITGSADFDSIEILNPTFFRNKGAYIVGRIRKGGQVIPLVIALLNPETGITVDAVLMDEKNVSNTFSYTRSNFHVDVTQYREIGDFLESIMPKRGRAAVYSAVGFMHPGKIELVKELRSHIRRSGERFELAKGIKGWVMAAFTLPSFPYVFKIIADKSDKEGAIKSVVKRKYELVHETDRAGRMLDSLTYKNLQFDRELFTQEIIDEITQRAPSEIKMDENKVVLNHVYVQRKVIPLNIYLKEHENDPEEVKRVLEDWGFCIKGLAVAGIWVGDFKSKNFGVTSTGRIVSFDYDELRELDHLEFEKQPRWHSLPSADDEESYASPGTAWHDKHAYGRIYLPDEFGNLEISSFLETVFKKLHPDLFNADYWQKIQTELREGKVPDVFPYALSERLKRQPDQHIMDHKQKYEGQGNSLGLADKLDSILKNVDLKQSA